MGKNDKPITDTLPPPAPALELAEAAPPVTAVAAPVADKKPIEDWAKLKGTPVPGRRGAPTTMRPHWLHDAAIICNGWAQIGTMLTEAEYDAGLKAAGDTPIGYAHVK